MTKKPITHEEADQALQMVLEYAQNHLSDQHFGKQSLAAELAVRVMEARQRAFGIRATEELERTIAARDTAINKPTGQPS